MIAAWYPTTFLNCLNANRYFVILSSEIKYDTLGALATIEGSETLRIAEFA